MRSQISICSSVRIEGQHQGLFSPRKSASHSISPGKSLEQAARSRKDGQRRPTSRGRDMRGRIAEESCDAAILASEARRAALAGPLHDGGHVVRPAQARHNTVGMDAHPPGRETRMGSPASSDIWWFAVASGPTPRGRSRCSLGSLAGLPRRVKSVAPEGMGIADLGASIEQCDSDVVRSP